MGRDRRKSQVLIGSAISIHAPRVGRDKLGVDYGLLVLDFNPRAPCGARPTVPSTSQASSADFNPRAPCGARRARQLPALRDVAISIHAPRVGRDYSYPHYATPNNLFQSTRPVWGATLPCPHGGSCTHKFQSTRPVWGATACWMIMWITGAISIHAPRVGRDRRERVTIQPLTYFNPRAPCGARPVPFRAPASINSYFNPRAPCGARPLKMSDIATSDAFQSTRPVWGATNRRKKMHKKWFDFNPRAPCGARRVRAGHRQKQRQFQSTRPVWGATT